MSMSHEINLAKRAVEESKQTKLSLSNEIELAVRNEEKKKRRKKKEGKPSIQTNSNEVMEQDEILQRLAEMELSLSIEIESAKKAREESEAIKNLLTEQLAMVRENIEVNKGSIEVNRGSIEVNRENIEVTKENIEVNKESIEVNRENIEQVIGDVTLHKNDITSMQEDITSMNNSEEAQKLAEEMEDKILTNVDTNQDEMLKKLTNMESKTNSLSQYHSSFQSSIVNINRRMDQVERNVGFANGEVREMSGLAEQLKYELEALKKEEANRVTRNELIALKTKVLSNKGDIRDSEKDIRREMNDKPR